MSTPVLVFRNPQQPASPHPNFEAVCRALADVTPEAYTVLARIILGTALDDRAYRAELAAAQRETAGPR